MALYRILTALSVLVALAAAQFADAGPVEMGQACAALIGERPDFSQFESELAKTAQANSVALSGQSQAELLTELRKIDAPASSPQAPLKAFLIELFSDPEVASQAPQNQYAWLQVIDHVLTRMPPASRCVLVAATERRAGEKASKETYDPRELEQDFREIMQHAPKPGDPPLLSIVIPAYKEAKRLPESLRQIQLFLKKYPLPVEVLVMVEPSPDNTVEVSQAVVGAPDHLVRDPRIQVIANPKHGGKGFAVQTGMQRAKGQYVMFMDADLSTPLPEILKFTAQMIRSPGTDVLIGNRNNPQSDYIRDRSLSRKAMSAVFSQLTRRVSGLAISDTQAGFKMFTAHAAAELFGPRQKTFNFSFDVEALLMAQRLGLRVDELPIQWKDAEGSTVNKLSDPLKMLWNLLRVRSIVNQTLADERQCLELAIQAEGKAGGAADQSP